MHTDIKYVQKNVEEDCLSNVCRVGAAGEKIIFTEKMKTLYREFLPFSWGRMSKMRNQKDVAPLPYHTVRVAYISYWDH